ncbi:MAG TPA: Gfo/Idh/MocA family oxidoreductase [Armatimonadota bacterium]|nr:Gfo/Idh/MocA family oxidoreductase [Armatimonadota bacterium]HOS43536.1 Gfo/Idh/MocA family oxidoreductase [Armatimonadota bacterium]
MSSTLHFGIIGCGVIGPVHANAIAHLPHARLVGVCDTVRERADRLAHEYAVPFVTTEYQALLERPDLDAVCICTPHYLHAEMAIAAAAAGKHVFCEKPMAISPAQMDAMIAAAERAGVQLGICFQHRFDPVVAHLRQLIADGGFGRLLLGGAHCRCLRDARYYTSEQWRGTWQYEGGGVLINQAIHTIDLMLWLLGEPTSVQGTFSTLRWHDCIEVEDTATGVVTFASGAQGHIVATSASHLEWDTRLHVYGTEGSAVVSTGFPVAFTFLETSGAPAAAAMEEEAAPQVGKTCYGNSHIRALEAFTDAVLSATPYPITGHSARRAVEVILGLYASSRAGTPVQLAGGALNEPAARR